MINKRKRNITMVIGIVLIATDIVLLLTAEMKFLGFGMLGILIIGYGRDWMPIFKKEKVKVHQSINQSLENISLGESIDFFNGSNEWNEMKDEGSKELFAPSPKGEILFEKSGAKYIVAACVLEKCYKIALQTSHPDGQEKIKLFSKQYGSPIKEESWWNIWDDGETTLEIMTRMPVVNIILTDKELFQKGFNQ